MTETTTGKKLFLLDAFALIFRAYYALVKNPRITSDGFNSSAIFGFVNTLEEILRKEKPTHIAVCFDPQGPTFRSEADAAYKAGRDAMPEDIRTSLPIIKEIIRAYNIPVLETEGFEADDVIGTMARRAANEGYTTYMMTPDKDFGQLVGPNVLQYKPSYRGQDFEIRGEQEICERYQITSPHQVIDLLALMGDKVDNIPGCPGVGEVTAVKLIRQFGSVDKMLANTQDIKGKLRVKIEENAQQIRDSYFLATIRTDVPVDARPDDLVRHRADRQKLFAIFKELEFRTLSDRVAKRLDDEQPETAPKQQPPSANPFPTSLFDNDFGGADATPAEPAAIVEKLSTKTLATATDADMLARRLEEAQACAVDFVALGENDMTALIKGAAVALSDTETYYVPATSREPMAALLDALARTDLHKVCTEAKRTYVLAHRLRGDNVTPLANYGDISVAHYLLQPDMGHTLPYLALQYEGLSMLPDPVFTVKRGSKATLSTPEEIALWACERAAVALRLNATLLAETEREGMGALLNDVELPLSTVLADMEITGVRIDTQALNEAAAQLQKTLDGIEKEVFDLVGEEFNIGSPQKVAEILFDKLDLEPKPKKTAKTGQYSTGEAALEKVAGQHPVVDKILEYRQLKKLLTTYLLALPAAINPATGRVHTVYNQTVTATGRISSSAPNLQNIPVREDQGREIRRAFIPSPGNLFLSADYSQIELRLVADMADDETMLDAFANDKDIHAITAAKIYHKTPEEVSADERRHAKTANFGILYGISAFGLAQRLGIPRSEAKELIDNYFATFPTIRRYMDSSIDTVRNLEYASTRMGRKRRLPDINSKNPVVRGYAERNAINAPIQGTAADIIKVAMVAIYRRFAQEGLKSKMIMQVHDELNFDVVPAELPRVQEIVQREMEAAWSGRVRLTASSGVASNWLDAH